jgi:peptidoglycan/LPS O-acetylase OafA/YrhL
MALYEKVMKMDFSEMRFKALDLFRGIACLWVVVYHAYLLVEGSVSEKGLVCFLLASGHYGVQLFFVISGYCIAACISTAKNGSNATNAYLLRRGIRIYPT